MGIKTTIFEGKDKMIVTKCNEENGIEVTIHEPMGKVTTLDVSITGKQIIEQKIFKAMGKKVIFVEKGVELIVEGKKVVFEVMWREFLGIKGTAHQGTQGAKCEMINLVQLVFGKTIFTRRRARWS